MHLPFAGSCTRTLWLPDVGADETRLQEALRRALQVQTFDET